MDKTDTQKYGGLVFIMILVMIISFLPMAFQNAKESSKNNSTDTTIIVHDLKKSNIQCEPGIKECKPDEIELGNADQ